jgi:mono/diheme cytochrome c family protein
MRRIGPVLLGFLLAIVLIVIGGYIFIVSGGVPMATSSAPLPLEETVAKMVLRANYKGSLDLKNPLPLNDENLKGGANTYNGNCAMCHGALDQPRPALAKAMFPPAPQLLTSGEMVADDPEGETFWKVTNGIRLSGMPAFGTILNDTRRWQVTMLLAHADKLTPAARKQLLGPE